MTRVASLPLGLPLVLLGGCALLLGITDPQLEGAGDGGFNPAADAPRPPTDARTTDAPHPAPDAMNGSPDAPTPTCGWLYVPTRFDPCDLPPALIDATLGDGELDVDTGRLTQGDSFVIVESKLVPQPGALSAALFVFVRTAVTGHLRVVGSRPAILAFGGDLTLGAGADIDLSATMDADGLSTGAAGSSAGCDDAPGPGGEGGAGVTGSDGYGGGGGGGLGLSGGRGGNGGGSGGGVGGLVGPPLGDRPGVLLGGCRGGNGGGTELVSFGGVGGAGGGAVQISVNGLFTVEPGAKVEANGAGGRGITVDEPKRIGSGGGGAGGTIFVEATEVVVDGSLCANGGTGGQAHGTTDGGAHGAVGLCQLAGTPPPSVTTGGALGGAGGSRNNDAGSGQTLGSGFGGGGGGGGVGFVEIRSTDARLTVDGSAVVSPMYDEL